MNIAGFKEIIGYLIALLIVAGIGIGWVMTELDADKEEVCLPDEKRAAMKLKAQLEAKRKAVELDPDNADLWNELGLHLRIMGEHKQSEAAYHKVLALSEAHQDKLKQALAYSELAVTYRLTDEPDKAEEMYRKALALDETLGNKEDMADHYSSLGMVYYTLGELDKAEEMCGNALMLHTALDSRGGIAADYANLGHIYKSLGNLDQAEEMWKNSLSLYQAMGHPHAEKVHQWLDILGLLRADQ